ncbi:probable serine/threonine-protein kinase DDB_G0281745 [Pocillopora verrucosa]|uniref:probable serine/threonine-protein kinase DDB_G0281745 n=1 Tax=Pocillopora verrucosa TaxID=203993 RepID=UPI00333F245E
MTGYWNQNPFTNSDFIFRCQFLGMKDIRSDDLCREALKELKALAGSFWLGCKETHCKLCIDHVFVIIEKEETGFILQRSFSTEISLIIQDPDDKTVFGYVYSLRSFLGPIVCAFKSEEAEVIVKTLREYTGLTNNIMGKVAGSLDGYRDPFQNLTHLMGQPQEKERKEANLSMVKENRSRRTSRTLRASRQTREQELVNWSEKMGEMTQQFPNFQNQLQRKDSKGSTLERKIQQLQNEVSILRTQQVEQCQEVDEVRRQKASVETQLRQMEQQQLRERDQVEAQNQRLREVEQQLAQRGESSYDWIISRNEVQVTNKRLGSGGWGTVYEGRYCGCDVAVKQIHEDFASAHRLKMFQREIDMASKCRHPCLLQFIGATIDEGFPLLVTELMETSLRRLLRERPLHNFAGCGSGTELSSPKTTCTDDSSRHQQC